MTDTDFDADMAYLRQLADRVYEVARNPQYDQYRMLREAVDDE